MSSRSKSVLQTLKSYMKPPWSWTGPTASPEYKSALPMATEYRPFCPATIVEKAVVPTADPETVFDIKYFSRDQRRNRPPIKRTTLRKADVEEMKKEANFDLAHFPQPYLTTTVQEDYSHIGGGYQN